MSAPAREKGPLVWMDMDQAELDAAYDQLVWAPQREQILARYLSNSNAVRSRLGEPLRLSYGPSPEEKLDVYRTAKPNAPIHVFVHGGAWRVGVAREFAYAAENFVHAGAHFVVLDFVNVLQTGGDLFPMAQQVRSAIAWVYRNAKSFGGDPEAIHLTAHSSGAHLSGVALTTDWEKDFGVPANVVKTGLLCSGMYDLKPVRLSARSRYVKFTDEMEEALSSQRRLKWLNTPLILCYGTCESPEFQRQSRDFAAAVKAAGKPAELIVAENYNHFEGIETLANPYGLVGRAKLAQMGLRYT